MQRAFILSYRGTEYTLEFLDKCQLSLFQYSMPSSLQVFFLFRFHVDNNQMTRFLKAHKQQQLGI